MLQLRLSVESYLRIDQAESLHWMQIILLLWSRLPEEVSLPRVHIYT